MGDTELVMERLRELGQRLGYVELVLTQGHPPPDSLSQRVAVVEIGLRELELDVGTVKGRLNSGVMENQGYD